jgi:hypothetical protein
MNLKLERFHCGECSFLLKNGNRETLNQYTYETYHKIYDVVQYQGKNYYRVNMGTWRDIPEKIHVEIEKNFKLD